MFFTMYAYLVHRSFQLQYKTQNFFLLLTIFKSTSITILESYALKCFIKATFKFHFLFICQIKHIQDIGTVDYSMLVSLGNNCVETKGYFFFDLHNSEYSFISTLEYKCYIILCNVIVIFYLCFYLLSLHFHHVENVIIVLIAQ